MKAMKIFDGLFYMAALFFVCLFTSFAQAQSTDSVLIISPGISPAVAPYRHLELALFNQLNTEKSVFQFDTLTETSRFSALYHVLQLGYGVDKHNRLNVGGIFIFGHTRSDLDETRRPFAAVR